MPMTDEEKALFQDLLKRAREDGENYVSESVLRRRLTEKSEATDKVRDEYETRLKELEDKYSTTASRLREFEDKGKSAEQKRKEELTALQAQRDAALAKIEETEQARQAENQRARDIYLENWLASGLSEAVNPEAASVLAKRALRGLSVEDKDGRFAVSYLGDDDLPADPKEALTSWLDADDQAFLRRAKGESVPATTPRPGSNGIQRKSLTDMTPEEAMEYAMTKGSPE